MRKHFILLILFAICSPSISQARTDDYSVAIAITNIVKKEQAQLLLRQEEIIAKQEALYEEWDGLPKDDKAINYQSINENQNQLTAEHDAIRRQLEKLELTGIMALIDNFQGNQLNLLDQIEQQTPLTVKEKLTREIGYIYTALISFLAGLAGYVGFIQKRHNRKTTLLCQEILETTQKKATEQENEIISKAQKEAATLMSYEKKSHIDNNAMRLQLEKWQNCLYSANQKLVEMKESHISTKMKIIKTLSIIKNQYPQGEKHFRYIENKTNELSVCYKNAKDQFEILYG